MIGRRELLLSGGAAALIATIPAARGDDKRGTWLLASKEDPIDPTLPAIDAHHHIWPQRPVPEVPAYTADDLFADIAGSGHNVVGTVFCQGHPSYRGDGPRALWPVPETAMAEAVRVRASSLGRPYAGVCGGIVSLADMSLGAAVEETIVAHKAASAHFSGVRATVAYDPDLPYDLGTRAHMLADPVFRAGVARVAPNDITLDLWALHPQLGEVADLAAAFPDTRIVLNHMGSPLGIGRFANNPDVFRQWQEGMAAVARNPNMFLKVGGMNMPTIAIHPPMSPPVAWSSERIAEVQGPYFRAAVDLFGPARCMFETNYPADAGGALYGTIWNSFKRMASGFSPSEKTALFSGTAARAYKLEL